MRASILIKQGLIINPRENASYTSDLLISDGLIKSIKNGAAFNADITINADGLWVCPGLFDMHAHFRDPGFTHKEDIVSGQRAAAAGGYAGVLVMPNTNPVTDSPETVRYIREKADERLPRVFVCGAVTKNYEGKELTNVARLVEAGIVALSEDGRSVLDEKILRDAFLECKKRNIPMLSHCEDENAPPGETEISFIRRDARLARETGAALHICHVSEKQSADFLRNAKKQDARLTGEVSPHHIFLTRTRENAENAAFKVNPPLKAENDRAALAEALKDGAIDAIATDHAPHAENEKNLPLPSAPPGFTGLETAVGVCVTALVKTGILTPLELIKKMSQTPADILNLPLFGGISENAEAYVTIIDPDRKWRVTADAFRSKSKNSPFIGQTLTGKVKYTIISGEIIYAGI